MHNVAFQSFRKRFETVARRPQLSLTGWTALDDGSMLLECRIGNRLALQTGQYLAVVDRLGRVAGFGAVAYLETGVLSRGVPPAPANRDAIDAAEAVDRHLRTEVPNGDRAFPGFALRRGDSWRVLMALQAANDAWVRHYECDLDEGGRVTTEQRLENVW